MDLGAVSLYREEGRELESLSECLLTKDMGDFRGFLQEVREIEHGADTGLVVDGVDGQTAEKGTMKRQDK